MFENVIIVSFGDCDPAGIVFYPNYYRWFDATFQGFFKSKGLSLRTIEETLGAVGTGLIDTGATFLYPITYGEELHISAAT